MGIKAKILIVAAGLALLVGLWFATSTRGPGPVGDGTWRPSGAPRDAAEATRESGTEDAATPRQRPDPAPGPDTVVLTGRVVDRRRFPVAGAVVTLRAPDGTAASARTDPDGRYRAGLPRGSARPGLLVGIRAAGPDGGVAFLGASLDGSPEQEIRVITLGPGEGLEILVTHGGAAVEEASVMAIHTSSIAAVGTTDAGGIVRLPDLPYGTYRLEVRADGDRVGRAEADLPRSEDGPIRVELQPARWVRIRVVDPAGGPVAGARFLVIASRRRKTLGKISVSENRPVPPLPLAPTDDAGGTVLGPLHPEDAFRLLLEPLMPTDRPGGWTHDGGFGVRAKITELRIELPATRTVAWIVRAGERPVPPAGARVALRPSPGSGGRHPPPAGEMRAGNLVVPHWPQGCWHATAIAPDGSLARLFVGGDGPPERPISFHAPRALEVVLREESGEPVVGARVTVRGSGNNVIAAPVDTDARGVARFTELERGQTADASLGEWWEAYPLGSVDLGKGDGRIVATLPAEMEIRLRVTVRGVPGLPGTFGIIASPGISRITEEEPEVGAVRLALRPRRGQDPESVRMWSREFRPVVAPVRAGDAAGVYLADLDFTDADAAVRLAVTVVSPPGLKPDIELVRVTDEPGGWPPEGRVRDDRLVYDALAPGLYRLTETASGLASRVFEVRSDRPLPDITFDVSSIVRLRGRVEVPEGTSVREARVETEFEGPRVRGPVSTHVRSDGSFRVTVPGDRDVTLTPTHPLLVPAAEGGTAVVHGAADDLVLRLVPGRVARVVLEPSPPRDAWANIRLFRGEPGAEPVSRHAGVLSDGVLRFGRFEPVRRTVWIDVPGFVPAILRDVDLTGEKTDLGTVRLSRGASVRVRVMVGEGQSAPDVLVRAERLEEPVYTRYADRAGAGAVLLRGLGPGRFRVIGRTGPHVIGPDVPPPALDRTVEILGEEQVDLTLDLR